MIYSLMVWQAARHCGAGDSTALATARDDAPRRLQVRGALLRCGVRPRQCPAARRPWTATIQPAEEGAALGRAAPQCPHISVLSSKEHGTAIDSARGMRSFDVRHRCSDEQPTPNHVLRTSKSITWMVQRGVLMEAAAVLFWRDPHFGDPPRSRLVRSILFAPVEIAGGTEVPRGRLGHQVGDLRWHRCFCNLPVRTKNSPRHEEGVRTNGIALRTNTVTHAAARAAGPLRIRCMLCRQFRHAPVWNTADRVVGQFGAIGV